jgi:glucokinase
MSAKADPRIVAFDVGGTSTRYALVEQGHVLRRLLRPSVHGYGLADDLAEALNELLDGELPRTHTETIGIAIPGPLSPDRRNVAFAGNLELRDYPLADLLEQRTGRSVVLDDDANCAALGEAVHGAAMGTRISVTIVVGTGIGAGIVVDGQPYRGAHSLAGELGHIQVERGGPRCSCGGSGCLEAMANGNALLARAGKNFASPEGVFAAARRGDALATAAVAETARYLAMGIAIVAMVIDPDRIVLAGGIGRQPILVDAIRTATRSLSVDLAGTLLDVRPSALGDNAGLIGAALLVPSVG